MRSRHNGRECRIWLALVCLLEHCAILNRRRHLKSTSLFLHGQRISLRIPVAAEAQRPVHSERKCGRSRHGQRVPREPFPLTLPQRDETVAMLTPAAVAHQQTSFVHWVVGTKIEPLPTHTADPAGILLPMPQQVGRRPCHWRRWKGDRVGAPADTLCFQSSARRWRCPTSTSIWRRSAVTIEWLSTTL